MRRSIVIVALRRPPRERLPGVGDPGTIGIDRERPRPGRSPTQERRPHRRAAPSSSGAIREWRAGALGRGRRIGHRPARPRRPARGRACPRPVGRSGEARDDGPDLGPCDERLAADGRSQQVPDAVRRRAAGRRARPRDRRRERGTACRSRARTSSIPRPRRGRSRASWGRRGRTRAARRSRTVGSSSRAATSTTADRRATIPPDAVLAAFHPGGLHDIDIPPFADGDGHGRGLRPRDRHLVVDRADAVRALRRQRRHARRRPRPGLRLAGRRTETASPSTPAARTTPRSTTRRPGSSAPRGRFRRSTRRRSKRKGAPNANPVPSSPARSARAASSRSRTAARCMIGVDYYWKHQGDLTRSFRYDAAHNSWSEIGETWAFIGEPTPVTLVTEGVQNLAGSVAARAAGRPGARCRRVRSDHERVLPRERGNGHRALLRPGDEHLAGRAVDAGAGVRRRCHQPRGRVGVRVRRRGLRERREHAGRAVTVHSVAHRRSPDRVDRSRSGQGTARRPSGSSEASPPRRSAPVERRLPRAEGPPGEPLQS